MKIGILSINAHTKVLNFASPLHSYAFQEFLKSHQIDAKIIDYKPGYYGKFNVKHPLYFYQKHPVSNKRKQKKLIAKWSALFIEREYRFHRFEEFINTYYDKTDVLYTAKKLDKLDPGFDCYICATDVIWKYTPKNGFDRGFFLACKAMEGKKKIAYAASRGPKVYTYEQAAQFFDYISDFDYISVRENSLQTYITSHSDLAVTHVLDPVFLQEKEFYYDLAIEPKEKNYVLLYIVMENSKELVKTAAQFAKAHHLELIELSEELSHAKIPKATNHSVLYGLGIEEWLGYMKNADYIFTNSFHACCFSIIFGKQFFAGTRAGDKIDSVLELFHLSNRRIYGYAPKKAENLPAIDYSTIEPLRQTYKKQSEDFILNAIHSLETAPHENHKDLVYPSVYKKHLFGFLNKLGIKFSSYKHLIKMAVRNYLIH